MSEHGNNHQAILQCYQQKKLTKYDWECLEARWKNDYELCILQYIANAASDPHYPPLYPMQSLKQWVRWTTIEPQLQHVWLFQKYMWPIVWNIREEISRPATFQWLTEWKNKMDREEKQLARAVHLKKQDKIRMENAQSHAFLEKAAEHHVLNACIGILTCPDKWLEKRQLSHPNHYPCPPITLRNIVTLAKLLSHAPMITDFNPWLLSFASELLQRSVTCSPSSSALFLQLLRHAPFVLDENLAMHAFTPITLYPHQRRIFDFYRDRQRDQNKSLVLYTAPTASGKTKTPIGLVPLGYRVLFMCAARHVGLDVARSAIAAGERVGIAFGCEQLQDVRLHFSASTELHRDKRTGAIVSADHWNGERVQLLICDVQSFPIAWEYLRSQGKATAQEIIVFYDEPVIGIEDRPMNATLRHLFRVNWQLMTKVVHHLILSCATLPSLQQLAEHTPLLSTFAPVSIERIESVHYQSMKSIHVLDKGGKVVIPHVFFQKDRSLVRQCAHHLFANRALWRYLNTRSVAMFLRAYYRLHPRRIPLQEKEEEENAGEMLIHFLKYTFTVDQLKEWYLQTLIRCCENKEEEEESESEEEEDEEDEEEEEDEEDDEEDSHPLFFPEGSASGVCFTTQDAHTLTHGQTLYFAKDIHKVSSFLLQQTDLVQPTSGTSSKLSELIQRLQQNEQLEKLLIPKIREMDDLMASETSKCRKMNKADDERLNMLPGYQSLKSEITALERRMQHVTLDERHIPNSPSHLRKYKGSENLGGATSSAAAASASAAAAWRSQLSEDDTTCFLKQMMTVASASAATTTATTLSSEQMMETILYLMGIGKLDAQSSMCEHVKTSADEEKLLMALATPEFMFGMNHQFAHLILGKDLKDEMTQSKIIQAMGRVGRGEWKAKYTVRFREDDMLKRWLLPESLEHAVELHTLSELLRIGEENH